MSWVHQADGTVRCNEHQSTFPAGRSCPDPRCGAVATTERMPTEGELLAAAARELGLPTMLEYERRFLDAAERNLARGAALRAAVDAGLAQAQRDKQSGQWKRRLKTGELLRLEVIAKDLEEVGRKNLREAADLATIREELVETEQLVGAAAAAEGTDVKAVH